VVLVGAGSAVFNRGLVADLLQHEWEGELRLVDTDPEALAVAEKLSAKMLASRRSGLRLSASTDRRALLKDATAVVCTIGVGAVPGSRSEHEQVVEIIESIRAGKGRVYSANLPNRGQIPNLPADAIVECPAVAAAGGMKPIQQRPLSSGIAGTLATRLQWVEKIVEAALERNRRRFVQALLLDGAAESVAIAERLASDLLAAQSAHLQAFSD